ncbi:hypothetical protein CRG98_038005 [Punica granatum]|uniref:ABC transmembrane type-1 domain-containing protein n=1 Tax=Punica granatum TaxID=22663 RepID=A0A2I0IC95_PUNGR|nr:hypothetical protein CRG98_038005 [Punica granatum]
MLFALPASSDFSVLDFNIPFPLIFLIYSALEVIAVIAVMVSVAWKVLIVAIPAIVASKYIQGKYLSTARELIRINGTTKAPVLNYATETSLGVIIIRAFGMEQRFFSDLLIDYDAKIFFHSTAVSEWLVLRIEAPQNVTLFRAADLILLPRGNFMHISSEPEAIVEDHRPPSSRPSRGRIEHEDLKVQYRPNMPLVLKGISCIFREGSRVKGLEDGAQHNPSGAHSLQGQGYD